MTYQPICDGCDRTLTEDEIAADSGDTILCTPCLEKHERWVAKRKADNTHPTGGDDA